MKSIEVKIGDIVLGGGHPVVPQTMLNTPTADIEATLSQAVRAAEAGAGLIRITVPSLSDVDCLAEIRRRFREAGYRVPLVADVHFSSEIAMAAARTVEKVRINPGNFHPRHEIARERFAAFLDVCKAHGTAVRIGLNHGSLGRYILDRYGATPDAMALAAMEWIRMCMDAGFYRAVVSLKASNTVVMLEAYRALQRLMEENGCVFPLHLGVTEAGNGETGRIKSCVAMAALLEEGIGDTLRVSLTEDPVNEVPVARYLAARYSTAAAPALSEREAFVLKTACDWGPKLLNRELDDFPCEDRALKEEILQACRRKFFKPEYIACPGCGRTLYHLEETFNAVKARTAHFRDVVIAVMGCIVNGPGEMADADYGYVGEGRGLVTLYKGKDPVLRHIPEHEAIDRLVALIEADRARRPARSR